MTKTAGQLYTSHPVGTVADGMKAFVHDGTDLGVALVEVLRSYYLDNASILALPGLVSLSNSNATNAANIAGLATQPSLVAVHGIGTQIVNSTTVSSDLYSGDAAVAMAVNDSLIYSSTYMIQNLLPTTNKSSTITTVNASSTITQTGGTTFASTDTDRMIVGTNIPANTYMTFVSSTSATLKDSAGVAVLATAGGTGIAATISSPDLSLNLLWKTAGNNSYQPSNYLFAATGTGNTYLFNQTVEYTQGTDNLHRTVEAHYKAYNAGSFGATGGASGVYSEPTGGRVVDMTWLTNHTTTDWGTTRPSFENRLNVSRTTSSSVYTLQRVKSSLYITRA